MSDVPVQKVVAASEQSLPVFRELDAVIDRIRERTFSIAADSGFRLGQDLDNWLSAEKSV